MKTYIITSSAHGITRLYTLQSSSAERAQSTQESINKYNASIKVAHDMGFTEGIVHNTISKLTYMDYVGMELIQGSDA